MSGSFLFLWVCKATGMSSPPVLKAILVDVIHPRMLPEHAIERLSELEELVRTYGGIVIVKSYQRRFVPHARTFIGPGKVHDLAEEGKRLGAKLIVINDRLKPQQMYNVMEGLRGSGMQAWDRIDLILKIFAKHAKTTEARLEIELASVRHMGPRIYGMGMELSRQGGGTGTRGIGETNTERMKRHLREQDLKIRRRLEQYHRVREGHRKDRERRGKKTVALVGYTNAGKTTLLNVLTRRQEYAANALFATLDTRVGSWFFPERQDTVLLSDTIGFIKQLPPELLNAFSSTLSEAMEADVLIHLVDASDPQAVSHIRVVEEILQRLHADHIPRVVAFNKSEDVPQAARTRLAQALPEGQVYVFISGAKQQGLDALREAAGRLLSP